MCGFGFRGVKIGIGVEWVDGEIRQKGGVLWMFDKEVF